MNTEELIKKINEQEFYIYGAGYVANVLYVTLKRRGLLSKFRGFVTTKGDSKKIDDYYVYGRDDINFDDKIIVLAVHESIRDEILASIDEYCCSECVWIYPYLFELMLGKPEKKIVPLKDIYNANSKSLSITARYAARYAALEEFYGNRTNGYETYLAIMEMHCSHETAVKRLNKFKELLMFSEKGDYKLSPISLLENYKIIDGLHRFAILLYNQVDSIEVNVFPAYISQNEIDITGVDITDNDIDKIDKKYKDILIDINKAIRDRYLMR